MLIDAAKSVSIGWTLYAVGGVLLSVAPLVPAVYTQTCTTAAQLMLGAAGILGVQKAGAAILPSSK